jgi:gamma-D-glutamyl-L-lysine dipeptidyl-peptidase
MIKTIKTPVASIYEKPSFVAQMITQALMWESVEILEEADNWYRIRQWDNYTGWVNSFYLTDQPFEDQDGIYIIDRFCPVHSDLGDDSFIVSGLSIGCRIPEASILEENDNRYKVLLPDSASGWIPKQQLSNLNLNDSIVNIANRLIGIPYLWGGKSSYGFDCSGFVQTVYLLTGIKLPRDSNYQERYSNFVDISIQNASAGDLIFFSENENISHVGIYLNDGKFIHCSGEVKINSFDSNDKLYCNSLHQKLHSVKSIQKILN